MLEEEIKKLTEAVKELSSHIDLFDGLKTLSSDMSKGETVTLPAETEAPVEVVPEKKKRKTRKKKEEVVEDKIMTATEVMEIKAARKEAPNVTKDDLINALRANVAKRQGDEFAKSVFEKHQSGATMSSLREEHYEAIYEEIKQDNAA